MNDALVHEPAWEAYRSACQKITAFHLVERDPFLSHASLTDADVRTSLEQTSDLIEHIRHAVK